MAKKKGWIKCKICGAEMKKGRLKAHMKKVHPKGTRTRKEKSVMEKRREAAKSSAVWMAVAAIIVVIIILAVIFWPAAVNKGTEVGQKPPNFKLEDPDDFEYELYDFVEDDSKPLLFEIMKTSCGGCRYLSTVLHDLYENYSDKIEFLSVASWQEDDKFTVKNFIANYDSKWTYLVDSERVVFDGWDLTKWPTIFIIGKDGKISWTDKDNNMVSEEEEILREIEKVI